MPAAAAAARSGGRKGPRPKHIPQRICVTCRERDAKRALVRIVRTPEGVVELDPTGRGNGRGAYLCDRPACWERALKTGALSKSLNATIDEATAADLGRYAATLRPAPDAAPVVEQGGGGA